MFQIIFLNSENIVLKVNSSEEERDYVIGKNKIMTMAIYFQQYNCSILTLLPEASDKQCFPMSLYKVEGISLTEINKQRK